METLSLLTVHKQLDDIVISDNEIDDDFLRYQGTQIKYENISAVDIEPEDDDTNNTSEYKENQNQDDGIESAYSLESSYDSYKDKNDYQEYERSYNVPDISIASTPNTSQCSMKPTNLIDISCSTNSSCDSFKEPKVIPSAIPRKRGLLKAPHAPVREVLKVKNTYGTPTNQGFRKPTPTKSADKFKHVQSPVRFYIKHSATAPICRNVHTTKLPTILPEYFFEDVPDLSNRWEFTIPEIIYKPSAVQYQSREKEIHLPQNIKALMPTVADMYMTKHETRIKGIEESQESIRRKLDEDMDLTMMPASSTAEQDISIIQVKPYF